MFKKVTFSLILFFSLNNLVSQTNPLNVQQFAHIPKSGFMVPSELNDIWGWVDNQETKEQTPLSEVIKTRADNT